MRPQNKDGRMVVRFVRLTGGEQCLPSIWAVPGKRELHYQECGFTRTSYMFTLIYVRHTVLVLDPALMES